MTTKPGREGRRSTRVLLEVPILVEGVDAKGERFQELGQTEVVNKHGAKIRVPRALATDSEVIVTLTQSGRSSRAVVVWAEASPSGGYRDHYGIRLDKAENLWGLYFPPSDWHEPDAWHEEEELPAAPASPTTSPADLSASALAAHIEPENVAVPPLWPLSPSPTSASSSPASLDPLEIPNQGTDVVVRGISAARMPFQERSYLEPVSEREATVGVRTVIDIGVLVQLIFPELERAIKARTAAVSSRPVKDRWKMWVNLVEPIKLVERPLAERK